MEQGISGQKVFYVYGFPLDQFSSDIVENFFSQNGVKEFSVVRNKVRIVVGDKESIETMRKKFQGFEGRDLFIMPELLKEVRMLIDEEWIKVIDQFCPNFKTILTKRGVGVSKTSEGVFLIGSLEDINKARQIITEEVEAAILKTELSSTAMNGNGVHISGDEIHTGSELVTELSSKDSEFATRSRAECRPNGTSAEKFLTDAACSYGGNDNFSESDRCDLAVAAPGVERNVGQSGHRFQERQAETNASARNLTSSLNANGMPTLPTADQRVVGATDLAISSGLSHGSVADAYTISLEDWKLQFVKRFYSDMYEPLAKHPTLNMDVRSRNYKYLSDTIKKFKIDRLIKVIRDPESVVSKFLSGTNFLKSNFFKRLTIEHGGKLKLLVSDPFEGNTVEVIGLPEDIEVLEREIDKCREALLRKASHECLSLNDFQIAYITRFYSVTFEGINREFLVAKESEDVTWILGTSDNVNALRSFIKKQRIDHLQREEQIMPQGVDENMCRAILKSLKIKIYLEFPSSRKILIVGLKDDLEKFRRMLQIINSDETRNAAVNRFEQTSSSIEPVGPVTRTGMTEVIHKSNEPIENTSSGTNDGGIAASKKTIYLQDCQLQFTRRFYSDLYDQLIDYEKQNLEVKTKHYARLLDAIKNNNIDRVQEVTETVKDVETSVLQRFADKLPRSLKVLVTFPSQGNVVEIIGLPEDVEKWWILLRNEIDAHKSVVMKTISKKMPQASVAIQTHEIKFIQTFYSEVYDSIKDQCVQKKSENEILYAGTFDEVDKLKGWFLKHDIDRLEKALDALPAFVDEEDCKEVRGSAKLCLSFPPPRMYEVIGSKGDIRNFKDHLKQRGEDNRKKSVAKSAQATSSSRTESDSSHLYGAMSSSGGKLEFLTPLSSIHVKIERGDLTKQRTDAIVNPCNGYLRHLGGAAKAIADAAGRELSDDCKKYIEKNKCLKTSEVMHTRSGRLNPPIKHVIHAAGPDAREHSDRRKCQALLENTFFNCFERANDLHANSMSVPAISSGTFGVPKDDVALSTWNALMRFDEQMSKPSRTSKSLNTVCFINIDQESTNSLIQTFKMRWNEYLFEQKSKVEAAKSEGSKTSPSTLRRSGSFSLPRGSSLKDVEGDRERTEKGRAPIKQNHDSDGSKSVRGTTQQGVVPQIKSGSAGSGVKSSAAEAKCCVCLKSKKISHLFTRRQCPHKACVLCVGECRQCTRSTKMESGPSSARALVQSPTGDKEESDIKRRPESPETAVSENAKSTTRSRRSRRSASVGDFRDKVNDANGIDPKEEGGSDSRASSSAASSIGQQLQQEDNCCICMDKIDDPKKLDCGHVFCKVCIETQFKHQPKCPSCGRIFGVLRGNQPDGKMTVKREKYMDLEGYRGCGTIVITYDIPDGIQGDDHQNPGKRFHGTFRTAYLPGNVEGEEVCRLLKKAFDAKLIFTVGKSNTTGHDNVVIWNDIHHKTSTNGEYGYPDPTYLQRVTDELAAKGIKSDRAGAASSSLGSSSAESGSATGGYVASLPYSRWDNNYTSLPVTGAHAARSAHSRDYGSSSSGRGSALSHFYSDVAGVHAGSSRASQAVSPVKSTSHNLGNQYSMSSSSGRPTTVYSDSLSRYLSTTSSAASSLPESVTERYSLRSLSSASRSANSSQPSYYKKY